MANGTEYVLAVRSVTSAMRAQKLLEREGIRTTIQRSTDTSRRGCGYTVKIKSELSYALGVLQAAGIEVLDVQG